MDIPLDEVVYFDCIVSTPATGAAVDADSTPTFIVLEEATDTDIGVGGNLTKRTSLTGNYRGSFTASAANGFEAGKWYSVIASAVVGGVTGKVVARSFRIVASETVAGVKEVDLTHVEGTAYASSALGNMVNEYDNGTLNADLAGKVLGGGASVITGAGAWANDSSGAALATAAKVLKYTQLLARKDAAIATDNATELTAINASGGSGAGAFANTTDSLEALANGSASSSLTITPLSATVNSDALSSYDLTVGQYAGKSWTLVVTDSDGAAVNLSGKTVKVAVWKDAAPLTIIVSLSGTVSGTSNNYVTFAITGTNTATAGNYRFTMRNTTDDQDLLEGTLTVTPAPDIT